MTSDELRQRIRGFAIQVIRLLRLLPRSVEGQVMGKQLLRSATSVAANYRAAGGARSRAEFYSKLCIVVEEVDEVVFWLEMIRESKLHESQEMELIIKEATELLYIFSASRKTAKDNLK